MSNRLDGRGFARNDTFRDEGSFDPGSLRIELSSGGRRLGHRRGLVHRHGSRGIRPGPATSRYDRLRHALRESEAAGPIDDMRRLMSINQRFGNNETRTERADLWFGRDSHAGHLPFLWRSRGALEPKASPAQRGRSGDCGRIRARVPYRRALLTAIIAMLTPVSNRFARARERQSVRTPQILRLRRVSERFA